MPTAFSHVIEPAQALLVAAIASELRHTLWIVCSSVRSQELLHESLLNWLPDALLLPEAEFAAVENILPDPEIAAERLALLTRVERERAACNCCDPGERSISPRHNPARYIQASFRSSGQGRNHGEIPSAAWSKRVTNESRK